MVFYSSPTVFQRFSTVFLRFSKGFVRVFGAAWRMWLGFVEKSALRGKDLGKRCRNSKFFFPLFER